MNENAPLDGDNLVKWAFGITTVPKRRELFENTLRSLDAAGFGKQSPQGSKNTYPHIFIDGGSSSDYESYDLPFTARTPKVRVAGAWILAAVELYVREPSADRFAIFQDDLIASKNLKAYLDRCQYPNQGYWNLYTFPSNQRLSPGKAGWFLSNQFGRGAVALVFSRDALVTLFQQKYFVERPQDVIRGWRSIDGGIVETFKRIEWKEYVHDPSLVQHTGKISSWGNNPQLTATSFRGESFDLLELLK